MEDIFLDGLKALQEDIRNFVSARGWDEYHTPRNISVALSLESAELLECFQWMKDQESMDIKNNPKKISQIKEELADIFFCLLRMADLLDVDLVAAFKSKMIKNSEKYPIELAYGRTEKYSDLQKCIVEVDEYNTGEYRDVSV